MDNLASLIFNADAGVPIVEMFVKFISWYNNGRDYSKCTQTR